MRKMHKEKSFSRRIAALMVAVSLLLSVFLLRLVQFQLINGEYYYSQAARTVTYTFPITAARGEIVDRYGRPLATNTTGYNVELNKLFLPDKKLNEVLLQVTEILEQNGEGWNDSTPLTLEVPFEFTGKNEDGTDGPAALQMKKDFSKQEYATAQQVFDAAVKMYGLGGYPPETQRRLLGIRYEMGLRGYSTSVPFTLAGDVSDKTVSILMENGTSLPGVDVQEVSVRVYPDGETMPHLLGRIGLISQPEWEADNFALQQAGYQKDDMIGKFGLEQAYEQRLRGKDGLMEVVRKQDGTLISSRVVEEPIPGETIVLTIDKEFQTKLQGEMERFVTALRDNKDPKRGGSAEGGAVVVLDVKTGGVLASVNYPTYDINDYFSNYSELVQEQFNPLFDRAFMGSYRPGSAFKPVVALSGLLEGEISERSTIYCSGSYGFYAPSYTPRCLGVHGNTNVETALQKSCNVFFYDLGRRLTYEKYNETARALGLGVSTGVEVLESEGRLSDPETSLELGMDWSPADSSQAAIGQLNTAVTPLQMATYAATLANRGERLQVHLMQSVREFNTGNEIERFEPVVLSSLPDKNDAYRIVEEGMMLAAKDGSAGKYLGAGSPYVVASKTGSPQENDPLITNATTVSYGPVENPQIAVGVVIEKGVNGYRCAELVRAVFDSYYALEEMSAMPQGENQLLA